MDAIEIFGFVAAGVSIFLGVISIFGLRDNRKKH